MCDIWEFGCTTEKFIESAVNDAATNLSESVIKAVGDVLASLGTSWVDMDTPNLTNDGTSNEALKQGLEDKEATEAAMREAARNEANSEWGIKKSVTGTDREYYPNSGESNLLKGSDGLDGLKDLDKINELLGLTEWIAFGICVLSLIVIGARMGWQHRHEGQQHVDRVMMVLVATVIVSGSVGLVTALVPPLQSRDSSAVAFIQNSLWWYMIAVAVFGVIVGAARMAWEQRAEPGKDLVKSLLTLVVVSAVGLHAVALLVAAGDSFSKWILERSVDCNLEQGNCFGRNMASLFYGMKFGINVGPILIIILGLLAVFASLAQIVLMFIRSGMLVLLAGMLPLAAAATNTETGRNMFRKTVGWLLAFVLYKPAAAIVYATAFRLTGEDIFKTGGDGLTSIIVGLTLMVVALFALPALMTLIVPAVSGVASGSGIGSAALAGATMMPTGAIAGGLLRGRGGGSNDQDAGNKSSGPTGSTDSTGSPGSSGGTGESGPATAGATGPSGSAGASSAAGSAGAGAGAGAGSGAAAGSAAGPAGAAVGVGVDAVAGAAKAATGAVESAAEESSGGPGGSR